MSIFIFIWHNNCDNVKQKMKSDKCAPSFLNTIINIQWPRHVAQQMSHHWSE